MRKITSLASLMVITLFGVGCAITDYTPWAGHKTFNAKLWADEIAFNGFGPGLDGSYAYSVVYDNSLKLPPGQFPVTTVYSWHNNGFTGSPATPPAFNPDGIVNRPGQLGGNYASYNFFPPWTKDQKWSKWWVSTDKSFGCQFFTNITQDFSGSPSGPGTALCFNGPQEETDGNISELEDFPSLDNLFSRIWNATLASSYTMNLTGISFNGTVYTMIHPLSLGLHHNGLHPVTLKVDLTTPAGKELLQAILNNTGDRQPINISLTFSGGLTLSLPSSWSVAFNHTAISHALGQ